MSFYSVWIHNSTFWWRRRWVKQMKSFYKEKFVFHEEKNMSFVKKKICLSLIIKWIGYFMNVFHFHQNEEEILSFIIVIIQPQDYVFRKTRNKLSFRRMIKKRKKIKRTKKCLSETPQVFLQWIRRSLSFILSFVYRIHRGERRSTFSLSGEEISVFLPIMLCYLS